MRHPFLDRSSVPDPSERFADGIDYVLHARSRVAFSCTPQHGPLRFTDITSPSRKTAEATSFYVAGFPCQPFSSAGLNLGWKDPKLRGQVFVHVVEHLQRCLPRAFMLENVKGLAIRHKDTFETLLDLISRITQNGKPAYGVSWKLLDTCTHGGLPQHRPRIYIIGVRMDSLVRPFMWPDPVAMVPLSAPL